VAVSPAPFSWITRRRCGLMLSMDVCFRFEQRLVELVDCVRFRDPIDGSELIDKTVETRTLWPI
jgi:hypothetical protein